MQQLTRLTNTHWANRYRQKTIGILTTVLLCCGFSVTSNANNLPDLGSPDLVEYDSITEKKLGQAFLYALHNEYQLLDDAQSNQYVRQIGEKLASYTDSPRSYRFYIIDNPAINAFAGPDGIIGIHTGLISAVQNEDELAGVIAHEISHVTQNHLSRRYLYNSTQGSINSLASFIAAILVGAVDPNAGMAVLMGGMGLNMQEQLKNSRGHESEADSLGIRLLNKAGYDPKAMASFFDRLSKQQIYDSQTMPEILRTHPTSEHRLAEAYNRAEQLQSQVQPTTKWLNLIKLRIVQNSQYASPLDFKLKQQITNETPCYLTAVQEKVLSSSSKQCLLDNNLSFNQQLFNINLLLEKSALQNGERKQLLRRSEYLQALYPNNNAIRWYLADYYYQIADITKTINELTKAAQQTQYSYSFYKRLAEVYSAQNQQAYAYFNLTKAYLNIGNKERAIYYIGQAKTLANGNNELENEIELFIENNAISLKNKT